MPLHTKAYVNRFTKQIGIPTLIVTILCVLYIAFTLNRNNGDPLAFVIYDGHYSYQIAYRLFGEEALIPDNYFFREAIPNAYRFQRILYPFLARLLAANQPALIPWTLILINIMAIALGTWVIERLLSYHNTSHWYAIVYGLYAGNLVALRSDMNEPLAQALVMVAIWSWIQQKYPQSFISFALALLTKETALLFIAAYGLHSLIERQWRNAFGFGLSIIPYAIYQLLLFYWLGEYGVTSGEGLTWIPVGSWLGLTQFSMKVFLILSIAIVPIAILPTVFGFLISLRAIKQGFYHPYTFAILFNAIFILFLPPLTFRESSALIRVVQGLAISLLLFGALTRSGRILNYSVLWLFANVITLSGVPE